MRYNLRMPKRTAKKKVTSYFPHDQRHTKVVQLRLVPELADRFRSTAIEREETMGQTLAAALDLLDASTTR